MYRDDQPDYIRIIIAVFLAAVVLIGWQAYVDGPRKQQLAAYHAEQAKLIAKQQDEYAQKLQASTAPDAAENPNLSREERLALTRRLKIQSDKLHGSIALKGAKFDDLTLANYHVELDKSSPEVVLFSPAGNDQAYLAQIGWVAVDGKTRVPDSQSLWQADKPTLTANEPVTLHWNNGEGVTFFLVVTLDENYMFNVEQRVENRSGTAVQLAPFAYINRAHVEGSKETNAILHDGPMGVIENALKELPYTDVKEKGNQSFDTSNGWFGITDKYWLSAIIPSAPQFKTTYSYYQKAGIDRFQVDYLGAAAVVSDGDLFKQDVRLFAGAKVVEILDYYAAGNGKPPIPLFDRAVDFGALYFLTKPLFLLLNFFFNQVGNFGIAILLLTFTVKLALFPLANAGYKSAAQMRRLQPKMQELKERYGDDRMAFQKELMAMYKREKVNPASGCLPLLIQMPVFFALYKVLFVTIEMRHAPFFGWLKDLSAMDPSNVFTAFGLLEWPHPAFLHLGILPMLMCLTMVIQMRQQPEPTDPVQAKVIKLMPYFFLFIFASFPAGLVLYWIFSNILSIIQSAIITRKYGSAKNPKP